LTVNLDFVPIAANYLFNNLGWKIIKMRRSYYIIAFFLLLLSSTTIAGSIKGKVKNGTAGFKVPKNIVVELSRYMQNQQDPDFKLKTTINKNGYFTFRDIPASSNAYYQTAIQYKGISYNGKAFTITSKKQDVTNNITIYEPTKNDSLLQVSMHHFLIDPAKGFLNIKEVLLIENRGDRTYVGSIPTESGKFITVKYKLPKDASDVNLEDGLMSCCEEPGEGGIYDTMEILPGKKQIVFSYRIKAPEERISFTKQVTLPTKEFDILLYGNAVKLTGTNLQELPPQKFKDVDIKTYTVDNLKAGQQVDINLAGLSGEPTNWSNLTLAIFAAILLLTGILIYIKQKKNNQNILQTNETDVLDANEREIILKRIVMLDEKFEAGKIMEKDYLMQREKLKNKLRNL